MASLQKDLTLLRNPANIKKAQLASSPYVLRKIFAADPAIQRLIAAGEKVIPLISEEIYKGERPDEFTLAAFAFIVDNVKAEAAPEIFGPLFREAMKRPGPFFIHFAAHAIRSGLHLPVKSLEIFYSPAELKETQSMLR